MHFGGHLAGFNQCKRIISAKEKSNKTGYFPSAKLSCCDLNQGQGCPCLSILIVYGPKGSKWGQWVRGEVQAGVNHGNEEPSESKTTYTHAFLTIKTPP